MACGGCPVTSFHGIMREIDRTKPVRLFPHSIIDGPSGDDAGAGRALSRRLTLIICYHNTKYTLFKHASRIRRIMMANPNFISFLLSNGSWVFMSRAINDLYETPILLTDAAPVVPCSQASNSVVSSGAKQGPGTLEPAPSALSADPSPGRVAPRLAESASLITTRITASCRYRYGASLSWRPSSPLRPSVPHPQRSFPPARRRERSSPAHPCPCVQCG